ncbi:MAG TPA: threonine/serine dehydratase, partial [Jatrophihabitans sp.]|nr:threonine/serine dehydratase [Jatrophihabitans sp.]
MTEPIDRAAVEHVYPTVGPRIRRTPVLDLAGATLKLEQLQYAGSFKARGAMANMLMRDVPPAGVVAASGGNHGAAVAWAARELGVPATIFVPTVSSPAKIDRIRDYGANLVITGDRYADAEAASRLWCLANDAMVVHACDQPLTLLGQGTLALELAEQAPDLDTVLVAVGGGGLIGGIAAYYGGDVQVIGVEPDHAPTLTAALAAGEPVDAEAGSIAADALAPRRVGSLMFPIAKRFIRTVLVTDDAIHAAQVALWEDARVVAEPAGATAYAALRSGAYRPRDGERVGVVISGANTTA